MVHGLGQPPICRSGSVDQPHGRAMAGPCIDVLLTLAEAYEQEHYPLDLPDSIKAIKFAMKQKGLAVKDLEPMIGKSNRVYEVLNHKRPLTLKMIWRLHEQLGIPAESLIRRPPSRV